MNIRKIERKKNLLIIGSDGLWEFLNEECIAKELGSDITEKNLDGICDKLLNKARSKWAKNESMVDDITFITVFISENTHINSLIM